jgi:ankyrin repeat protein
VNQANDAGWTALMAACRDKNLEACRNLLAAGADVNLSKAPGAFPLMLAVVSRNFAILERFLEEHRSGKISLNFYQPNDSGETVLEIAEKRSELLM